MTTLDMHYRNAADLVSRGKQSVEADIDACNGYKGPSDVENAQDVISNVMHYIRSMGVDPIDTLRQATRNYRDEVADHDGTPIDDDQ